MWFGRWRFSFRFKWVNKLRILGVFFSNGLVDVECDNWKAELEKLKEVLGLWSLRTSFFRRARDDH